VHSVFSMTSDFHFLFPVCYLLPTM